MVIAYNNFLCLIYGNAGSVARIDHRLALPKRRLRLPADYLTFRNPLMSQDKNTLPIPLRHDDLSEFLKQDDFLPGKQKCHFNGEPYFIDGKSLFNAGIILQRHPKLNNGLIYDIFADDIKITRCPPWQNENAFKVHAWNEDDTTLFRVWLETCGFKLGKTDIADIISAYGRKNIVNPPKEYFEKLEWDRKPRLNNWLIYYCGAEYDNPEYVCMVGEKWLIGIVKRIYEPGCKFDTALILEGAQYKGKSSVFSILATIGNECYFIDDGVNFRDKDSLMKLQGKLIYEMAELVSFRKAETEEIKSFITRRIDMYRPPYGRKVIERPRMFVIGGSTNPSGGYLTDPTGNRRYWCVRIGDIDLSGLEKARDQLWAEAVYKYKNGTQVWLTPEEYNIACSAQAERVDEDVYGQRIDEITNRMSLDKKIQNGFTLTELLVELNISADRWSNKLKGQIQSHLTYRGFEQKRPRELQFDGIKQPRKWFLIPEKKKEE